MHFRLIAVLVPALFSLQINAQTSASNDAYAITSERMGMQVWTEIRQIDLSNGEVVSNVLESGKGRYNMFDGRSAKKIEPSAGDSNTARRPFSGLSAACAFDRKSNRLYYAPIFLNELRYIDLSTPVPAVYFGTEKFSTATSVDEEANQITRMVIAADGNGYALNNDGSHLIRFTTGKTPVVTDLGSLTDAAENQTDSVSVSDANTSWGGDMVADASGSLYLVTAHNLIFKIDLQTQVASFITKVKDIPEEFTTNGAVVDAQGKLVLSSANSVIGYYAVDPANWSASLIPSSLVYNTSDLANENLLFQTSLSRGAMPVIERVSVYPNPVKTNLFRVSFSNKGSGEYNIQLMDIAGRMISDKLFSVTGAGQTAEVKVSPLMSRGIYFVKVLSHAGKEIFSKKLLVE